MKSRFICFLILFLLISLLATECIFGQQHLDVTASSAILMDYTTGKVLYQKNAFLKRAPASTTKIVTAIVAIEHGKLNQMITASTKASKADGSSIWLAPGEQHNLKDLLYGILLSSGNDASVAVAESLAGTEHQFAAWMTLKAHELGARNSNFVNSNGLPEIGHYTTAFDLALITRYALHNPTFSEIVKTRKKIIDWPGHKWDRVMYNHNKLLWQYIYADGVKTGYTRQAGKCLVSSATKNGHRLIAVVLNSKSMYSDSTKLFNFGFTNFQLLTLATPEKKLADVKVNEGIQSQVPVSTDQALNLVVPRGSAGKLKIDLDLPQAVIAPVERLQPVGELEVKLGSKLLQRVPVVTTAEVPRKSLWQKFWDWVTQMWG